VNAISRDFPNYAGRSDVDAALSDELSAAGITVHDLGPVMKDLCRSEVKTSIVGGLHGWQFKRAWYYWTAEGPGLPPSYATPLHESHGRVVRVAGHCGCPSPLEWFNGFAVGSYHVDTPDGLLALAAALNRCASDALTTALRAADGVDFDRPRAQRFAWIAEALSRAECKRQGIDPDEIIADGGHLAWQLVGYEAAVKEMPEPTKDA
jgi:hypothetical protein